MENGTINSNLFTSLREKYPRIVYKSYQIIDEDDCIKIKYQYEIPGLIVFNPYISIPKKQILNNNINQGLFNLIVFKLGLVELISYYKCVCPKIIKIEAGYIDEYEKKWFKKLFFNGLGEFLYTNKINVSEDELFDFVVNGEKIELGSGANIDYVTSEGPHIPLTDFLEKESLIGE